MSDRRSPTTSTSVSSHLKRRIARFLRKRPRQAFTYKQIAHALHLTSPRQKRRVLLALQELEQEKLIHQIRTGKFQWTSSSTTRKIRRIQGTLDLTSSGVGFVYHPRFRRDILIPEPFLNRALHGDEVEVELLRLSQGRWIGRVVRILRRNKTRFTGTVDFQGTEILIQPPPVASPAQPIMRVDTSFPLPEELRQGDPVEVEWIDWDPDDPFPRVRIVRKLTGSDQDVRNQMIYIECGFPLTFSPQALQEADRLPDEIPESEWEKRADLRHLPTFTIDPADARDFDDALSIRKLDDSTWEVGIHIADVSWYVQPGTALDQEARARATSVYLVDDVLPMLPERLSSYLCSLRPHEDKLAFSILVILDTQGKILRWQAVRSIIRSRKRFTYEEAQKVLKEQKGPFARELKQLWQFAEQFRKERAKKGALLLESPEIRFLLNEQGKPTTAFLLERGESHFLIEEWMLVANRLVAEWMAKHRKPFIYRIHDPPPADRIREFSRILRLWGLRLKYSRDPARMRNRLHRLLKKIQQKPEAPIIEQLLIRSLAKARYSSTPSLHFGLQFEYYTHFTSPIRRYPDIVAHRMLWATLQQARPFPHSRKEIRRIAEHSTLMEIQAMKAEFLSLRFAMAEYAEHLLTENPHREFQAIITSLLPGKVFLTTTDFLLEGVVLPEDHPGLRITPRRFRFLWRGREYRVGEVVRVELQDVDTRTGWIFFRLLQD